MDTKTSAYRNIRERGRQLAEEESIILNCAPIHSGEESAIVANINNVLRFSV